MSGQLVGEVIAASGSLKARGLSERGFHALVAIAEKAHTESRQGSVRWEHIRAGLYGASLSTAKRAIADLRSANLVSVVKRGYDNQHGVVRAPIYEIAPLTERVTQVSQSPGGERVKSRGRTGQIDDRTGHLGDLLDGSFDGPFDGGVRHLDDEPRCRRHRDTPHPPKCHDCKAVRERRDAEQTANTAAADARRKEIRTAIDRCRECDQAGRLDDLSNCPKHPNFRTHPVLT